MTNSTINDKATSRKITNALKVVTQLVTDSVETAIQDIQLPPIELPVFRGDQHVTTIPGYVNPQLHKIITVSEMGIPVCLFGGSGVGKTTIAEQLAEALDLDFYCQTVTAGMPESVLLGRQIPNPEGGMDYIQTPFLKAVEDGGLFLLDEFDAIDENCALAINNLLEFGKLDLPMRPEKPRLEAHADFRFIACANTALNGASLIHNGRNKLDGATISRFDGGIFEIGYDLNLERILCPRPYIRNMFYAVRNAVIRHGIRQEISTRTLKRAEMLWKTGVWKAPRQLLEHFIKNWSDNEKVLIEEEFEDEQYKDLKSQMSDELMSDEEREAKASEEIAKDKQSARQLSEAESLTDQLGLDTE